MWKKGERRKLHKMEEEFGHLFQESSPEQTERPEYTRKQETRAVIRYCEKHNCPLPSGLPLRNECELPGCERYVFRVMVDGEPTTIKIDSITDLQGRSDFSYMPETIKFLQARKYL